MKFIFNSLCTANIFLCCVLVITCGKYHRPRGVSVSKALLYQPGENFTCFDGLLTIDFARVNDDYCDCSDGSDEPGTSACPNGLFDCNNHGYHSVTLSSSQVNDGICDCCDGSDEYGTGSSCVNQCFELGKLQRDLIVKQHQQLVAGHEMFKEYVKRGEEAKKEAIDKLNMLDKEKQDLEKLKFELEALKVEAEKAELEAKNVYQQKLTENGDASPTLVDADNDEDTMLVKNRLLETDIEDEGSDGVSDFDTTLRSSAADRARKEFDEVSNKLATVDDEIHELQLLLQEVGQNALFYIQNKCFDVIHDDYIYSVCPFRKAFRRISGTDQTVLLGKWSRSTNESIVYENGDLCSESLNFSAVVRFECSSSNELLSLTNFTDCQLSFKLNTPAACSQPPPASIRDPFRSEL